MSGSAAQSGADQSAPENQEAQAQGGGQEAVVEQQAQNDENAPANPLGLSDDDFLNAPPPDSEKSGTEESQQQESPDNKQAEKPAKVDKAGEEVIPPGSAEGADAAGAQGEKKPDDKTAAKPEGEQAEPGKDGKAAEGDGQKVPDATALANFYNKVMAPFTANGKKIELKTPEEAIQLMQMGANYTRKLQEIAPHRKVITMLGNHGLLDESKLSFLIALDKKDPEAIKKLIVESGIDPLDIDVKTEPQYREGSYQVTDNEVAFRTHLDELTSSDEGKQTLGVMNGWDQASKDEVWRNPEIMPIIHAHRESGIFATITTEMDRRRTLGQIPPTASFLEAYKATGDELHAAGAFGTAAPEQGGNAGGQDDNQQGASAEKPAPAVVATRAAAPRPVVDNDDKAGAASPTRASPGNAKEVKNFLAMTDEDFLKAGGLEGRV